MGGSEHHYKRAIIGPPAKCHLNAGLLMMAHIECWLSILMIFQGIWTRIAKTPIFLWFFKGGGGGPPPVSPPPPSLDLHMVYVHLL